jgi:hypothetical protein
MSETIPQLLDQCQGSQLVSEWLLYSAIYWLTYDELKAKALAYGFNGFVIPVSASTSVNFERIDRQRRNQVIAKVKRTLESVLVVQIFVRARNDSDPLAPQRIA